MLLWKEGIKDYTIKHEVPVKLLGGKQNFYGQNYWATYSITNKFTGKKFGKELHENCS